MNIRQIFYRVALLLVLLTSACNLSSAPDPTLTVTQTQTVTGTITGTVAPSTTPVNSASVPTTVPANFPTSAPPPTSAIPTSTQLPISIFILSPVPGNIISGNAQIIGSALHPQFLQYQLEYGPEPNSSNLWYPIGIVTQTPVLNGQLGVWNTTSAPDGLYTIRLRVTLRDGTSIITAINSIRVQNRTPTPVPSATPSIPRPAAAFVESPSSGQAPLTVRFFNQSTGNITSSNWNFGDGTTSLAINPVYTFNRPGIYTVTLTVTGPGGSSNVARQITVQSLTAPVAAFVADKYNGNAPLTVQFTSQSTGGINAYRWDFGDGTTSTDQNPLHTFTNVGVYNVFLTVSGPGGSSLVTRQITVQNPSVPAPTAAFTANPVSGVIPVTIQFTNRSTGNITNYNWNFGDGTLSAEANPTHVYAYPGTYTITLIASGPGGIGTAQIVITAFEPPTPTPRPIQASATFTPTLTNTPTLTSTATLTLTNTPTATNTLVPSATNTGEPTATTIPISTETPTLTATATNTETLIPTLTETPTETPTATSTNTDIPTATSTETPTETATSTETLIPTLTETLTETPTPTSTNTDIPTATSTNTDVPTATSTETPTETPTIAAPVASFTSDTTFGAAPLPVQFINQSSGDIQAYAWDFGDGGTSADVNPAYTYAASGTYTVTLTITGAGGSNSAQTTITVNAAAPVAAFVPDVAFGNAPLAVQFTNQSTGDIQAYAWDFGDGGTSADVNPAYTYAAPGTYTVTLTVTGAGGTNSAQTTITVNAAAPVAAFVPDVTFGNAPLAVQFTNQSTGDIQAYAWDFGDGGTSADVNPAYTYAVPGTYTVTLTVTGAGGTNSSQTTITVNAAAPVAAFVPDVTFGNAPLAVQFTNQSAGDIQSYAWDFGDGGTSADVNPAYTFAAPGTYTVTLTVTGVGGTNSAQTTITVNAAAPVAAFTQDVNQGNAPLAVQFNNQSTGDIQAYAWDFGDGGTSADVNPSHTYTVLGTYTVTLTVTGTGGAANAQTIIMVNAAAPVAAFAPDITNGNAPLAVQFTNQSTGDIQSYAWDFGDGNTSTDVNPAYTYTTPGTYTVTLTVTGIGGTNSSQAIITVNAGAPVATFTSDVTEGEAPLAVQFTNQSTGDIQFNIWDFGDGGTSADVNPAYTYATAGTYTVTLTVEGAGGSNSSQTTITVNEPAATELKTGIVDTTPIIPELDGQLVNRLRAVYDAGIANGNRASVFAIAGDDYAAQPGYLDPFAASGSYFLDGGSGSLQGIIDWYNLTDLGGNNSFNHAGVARRAGWTAADLVDPANSDPSLCAAGETPLACELRLIQPSVVIITVGTNDALQGTDPDTFRASIRQAVRDAADMGVIPVLATIPPRQDVSADTITALNEIIIDVATNNQVPVFNLWRALNELPNSGLNGDNVTLSVSPNGAGDLTAGAPTTYGLNALNYNALVTLDTLRNIIFPDAFVP